MASLSHFVSIESYPRHPYPMQPTNMLVLEGEARHGRSGRIHRCIFSHFVMGHLGRLVLDHTDA
jgi:hypothetical protein